ncbi:MAG TPA: peptidylprolyl isomerase [Longimicrobiales bacterium]|nr:peptidylprolyl isomerase [Longimicrobiales bacterium]
MESAKAGDTVRVHYTGQLADGEVFDSSHGNDPLQFQVGAGEVIQGFDEAVTGMAPGDKRRVTIPAQEAYGERREELVVSVPRGRFPPDFDPEPGMNLALDQEGQQVMLTIKSVTEEAVVLDGNHPLAGQDLTFDVELVGIE